MLDRSDRDPQGASSAGDSSAEGAPDPTPEASVVRIYATTQQPDYDSPWQAETPSSGTGSGVVIGSGRVLTGAHVVANATFVQVQKVSDPNKYVAKVAGICHDADLALLSISDRRFNKGLVPAEVGELPEHRDRVSVVGFPVGGEEVSITEGVVSRLEVQRYSHSQRYLLAVTIDAAINAGNSGGPVFFKDGRIAGIAFQTLTDAENVGEVVPPPLIHRFLEGIRDKKPLYVPSLSVRVQSLENPALKSALGLGEADSGVRVRSVEYGGSADGYLKPGDVILSIDGNRVHDNGTILYRDRFRTRFDVVVGERFAGEELELQVLRKGRRKKVRFELLEKQYLVPRSRYEVRPSYFVFAGLVFQPLTRDYLETWTRWWDKAPPEFLHHYYSSLRTKQQQEVVVLTQVLADELTMGYEEHDNEPVISVNGHRPQRHARLRRSRRSCRKRGRDRDLLWCEPGLRCLHGEKRAAPNSAALPHQRGSLG